jgi:DNA-binding PadR family transcriptional regulator
MSALSDDVVEVLRQHGESPALEIRTRIIRRRVLWWSRPPSFAALYLALHQLESEGRVERRWDEGPIPAARRGARRRLYRLRASA